MAPGWIPPAGSRLGGLARDGYRPTSIPVAKLLYRPVRKAGHVARVVAPAAGAALFLHRLRWHQSWRLDLRSHDRARLGPAEASVTYLARLSGGDECRRGVPTDVPTQVSDGTVESAVDRELT